MGVQEARPTTRVTRVSPKSPILDMVQKARPVSTRLLRRVPSKVNSPEQCSLTSLRRLRKAKEVSKTQSEAASPIRKKAETVSEIETKDAPKTPKEITLAVQVPDESQKGSVSEKVTYLESPRFDYEVTLNFPCLQLEKFPVDEL